MNTCRVGGREGWEGWMGGERDKIDDLKHTGEAHILGASDH